MKPCLYAVPPEEVHTWGGSLIFIKLGVHNGCIFASALSDHVAHARKIITLWYVHDESVRSPILLLCDERDTLQYMLRTNSLYIESLVSSYLHSSKDACGGLLIFCEGVPPQLRRP